MWGGGGGGEISLFPSMDIQLQAQGRNALFLFTKITGTPLFVKNR